ncbi:Shedu immune nuclease family protein [Francisella adeliensis]|uniref:DUF4263 domain-containing protein n=1 Tax=Francisella adeliensis TaxID=2007306 RepID=A0A2Z4XZ07_9GAMM|nr:Shedu immune nuclease family protein [Francisella adeliensis]AXA33712.1 hypothetical protein CDH04_04485 [Francisella adeliensis]MBK2085608.1 DUF4263 domain-containing protein [Francisella adeliensis]MBK2097486.1 DUF4263 domain-containing protein [Francisella adeliensis]QIW11946.1 DUF4263 domain-containing protein [Francisella adeliensis]QIW13822.1 DUF4263 domain-containing protein [Francisella adeliensis]
MKNYDIYFEDQQIILSYTIASYPVKNDWISDKNDNEGFCLLKTFGLEKINILKKEDDTYFFVISNKINNDGYFIIDKKILGLKFDLLIHESLECLDLKLFVSKLTHFPEVSIFNKIDDLINEQIIIGGNHKSSISQDTIEFIINTLPTNTEVSHYFNSRISNVVNEYFDTTIDYQYKLERYVKNRLKYIPKSHIETNEINKLELNKFIYIGDILETELDKNEYNENQWQNFIAKIIRYIYPKYIEVFETIHVKSDFRMDNKKEIDIMMLDVNGNIDIIEVKQPFNNNYLFCKQTYRGNYTPTKAFSGTIMQTEKYLRYLTRLGEKGEKNLKNSLVKKNNGIKSESLEKLKITNPTGMIIAGRSNDFNEAQLLDFEIIKRKYKNVVDIMSYDDLLNRINSIIDSLKDE